jgi:hypothetical protein
MKDATFGSFVVSAEAVQQGSMWTGVFRIAQYDDNFTSSTDFLGETHTDGTYLTRSEAEQAAIEEGREWVNRAQMRVST